MINWGIIGLGKIALRFSRSLENIEDGRLYAVASHQLDKLSYYAERFGAEKLYDDYSALLRDEKVDIVYIAVPHKWHYQWVMEALENGRNVLCEKPAVVTCGQVKEVFALARERKLFYMEAMKTRCMPLVRRIHELLDSGSIGDIREMEVHFTANNEWPKGHYIWDKEYGGSFYDQGCYGVASIADYLHADPEGLDVECTKINGVDDHTMVTYRYGSGIKAMCECAFNDPQNKRSLLIQGTKGTIWADFFYRPSLLKLENEEGSFSWQDDYGDDDFRYEIRHVHDCLKSGLKESPLMNLEDSLRYVRMMEMVRERIDEER